MKDHGKASVVPVFPQRIRTYVIINLALAVLMAVVMAVRTELRSGRFFFIDILLIIFYAAVLASITVVPIALTEIYLYRRKKGAWYKWQNQARYPRGARAMSPEEHRLWKREAYRVRLSQGAQAAEDRGNRTRLFESHAATDPVSRAALLMTVADSLERSGKREAAERCYLQITQRFAESPQAQEAARRLSPATTG